MGSSQAPNGNLPNSRPPTSPPPRASISKEEKKCPQVSQKWRNKNLNLIMSTFWKIIDLKLSTLRHSKLESKLSDIRLPPRMLEWNKTESYSKRLHLIPVCKVLYSSLHSKFYPSETVLKYYSREYYSCKF